MTARIWPLCLAAAATVFCSPSGGRYVASQGYAMVLQRVSRGVVSATLSGSYGANTCEIETGNMAVKDAAATYQPADDPQCRVEFHFTNQSIRVRQTGNCGCGLNVNLSGAYERAR
jgi:hypothetical protein